MKINGRSTSVGMRATPNKRVYWSISSGIPRTESGSRRPARKSWMNPRDAVTRAAARGSWAPRSGVGSFLRWLSACIDVQRDYETDSRTKNGLRARTTGSVWDK